MSPRFCLITLASAGLFSATISASQAATVVVPNANATTGGDAQGPAPFNYFSSTGSRNQVLYPASQFGLTPELISAISFRPYPGSATSGFIGGTITVSNAIITLSTTQKTESGTNALSATYATNTGLDATTVYSGPITLTTTATDTNGGATKVFDYTINLQTAFAYVPSLGNLLLDVNIPAGATVSGAGFGFVTFDNVNDVGDGVASVTNIDSGAAVTGTVDSSGAIAQFTFGAVTPEPASASILLGGVSMMAMRRRRRHA